MSTRWDKDSPSLLPTFVCYADILGFRSKINQAFSSGKETEFLQRIHNSVSAAYERVRAAATLGGDQPPVFEIKVFTDNIVVAYPIRAPFRDFGEPELGHLLDIFAEVQASLAADGFFLRGAITHGPHYQDEFIVYGKALLKAYDLDKSGKPPRLVLGQSVEGLILKHLSWYGYSNWTPHHTYLLEDPKDEQLFVNYLASAFQFFPDGPIDFELLAAHGKAVLEGLEENESDATVRSKYEWLVTYHNFVCRSFAELYPVDGGEWTDDEYVAQCVEAQRALEFIVPLKREAVVQFSTPARCSEVATAFGTILGGESSCWFLLE